MNAEKMPESYLYNARSFVTCIKQNQGVISSTDFLKTIIVVCMIGLILGPLSFVNQINITKTLLR